MRGIRRAITHSRLRLVAYTIIAWILFLIAAILMAIMATHLIVPPS